MEIGDNTTTISVTTTNTAATKNNTNTNNFNFNITLKGKKILRRIIFVKIAMFQGVCYVNKWGINDERPGTLRIE